MYTAAALVMIVLFFSAVVQGTRLYVRAGARHNLLRQAMACEEIVYADLRYAADCRVTPSQILFKNAAGEESGYFISGRHLYRRLDHGNRQPLTGNDNGEGYTNVYIAHYGKEPYFSEDGDTICMRFVLVNRRTGDEQICAVRALPLARIWRNDHGET